MTSLMAHCGTAEDAQVAEEIIRHMMQDGRLEEKRPDLRRKIVVEDILHARPGLLYWQADLLAALIHAKLKGRL